MNLSYLQNIRENNLFKYILQVLLFSELNTGLLKTKIIYRININKLNVFRYFSIYNYFVLYSPAINILEVTNYFKSSIFTACISP